MGWKNIKDHYEIDYIVHVEDDLIYIGSGYVPNAIIIDEDCNIAEPEDYVIRNENLRTLYDKLSSDKENLKALIRKEDKFDKYLPVYTFQNGKIIEEFCEEYGWPNTTHSGILMYDNYFFKDRNEAIEVAIKNSELAVKTWGEVVERDRKSLERSENNLRNTRMNHKLYMREKEAS